MRLVSSSTAPQHVREERDRCVRRRHLAAVVELMQSSDRVAGMLVAEGFDPHQLAAMATRIVTDDIFGPEKVMASGTQIYARVRPCGQGSVLSNRSPFSDRIGSDPRCLPGSLPHHRRVACWSCAPPPNRRHAHSDGCEAFGLGLGLVGLIKFNRS